MRQVILLLLTTLALNQGLLARAGHDWGKVEKLKPGSMILVVLWSGDELQGRLKSANPTGLSLNTDSTWRPVLQIARKDVRRIVHIRGPKLPDPDRWMLDGALIGGAVGVTAGAIQDARQGNNGRVVTQGLGGAGMGFFGSCAAMAAVGIVATVHHSKVVYESTASPRRRSASDAGESDTQ